MRTELYFDYEALKAALEAWDTTHCPVWVALSSENFPDDPRSCDPAIIDFVEKTLDDRGMEVERSSPGCQVWSEPNTMLPEAGAALARLLEEHRPLPLAGQAIMAANSLKQTAMDWSTDVRVFRMLDAGRQSFIELEDFSEAVQMSSIWLGKWHLSGCLLKVYVRDLPPAGPFLGHLGDGLPELVQVALLFWEGGHTCAISRVAADGSFLPLIALTEGEAYDFAWARLTELPSPIPKPL